MRRISPVSILIISGIVVILALAAWLRLGNLDVFLFENDEAEWANAALGIARGESFPLIGIPSLVSVNTGPVFLYLLALPMLISPDPAFVTGFVGLLNLASVGLLFPFARRYFGLLPAILATALYATGPWAVYHSRKIWNPNALPLVALLFFWSLFLVAVDRRPRFLILAAAACAVAAQLNQAGLVLAPILLVFTLLYWRRLDALSLVGAVGVGAALMASYLYFEVTHGFADVAEAMQVVGSPASVDLESARLALALIAGWGFPADIFGIWTRPGESVPDASLASAAVSGLLLLGLAVVLWRMRRPGKRVEAALLLAWLLLPIAVMARHGYEVHIRYLLPVLPAGYVLAGVGLATTADRLRRLASRRRPWRHWPAVGAAAALACAALVSGIQANQYATVLDLIERNGLEVSYGLPARYYEEAITNAHHLAATDQGEPVVLRVPPRMLQPLRYLARVEGLTVRFNTEADALILPPANGRERLYVAAFVPEQPDARLAAAGLVELPAARVAVPGGQTAFRFYRLPTGARAAVEGSLANAGLDLRLSSGLSLHGWEATQSTATLDLTMAWRLWSDPVGAADDPTLCLSQHLVDSAGRPLAVADVPTEDASHLREGDLVLSWTQVPLPNSGPRQQAWIDLGTFGCWKRAYAVTVDAAGKPASSPPRVGPFAVGTPLTATTPQVTAGVLLGEDVALVGYDLDSGTAAGELGLTLYWTAKARPAADYTVFVQLLSAGGLVIQKDNQPSAGGYPSSLWQVGELVRDKYTLTLPPGLPDGEYRLIAGMYTLPEVRRLSVRNAAGAQLGDYVALGTITLTEGRIAALPSF
ncbi:MAG: hypothetical protein ACYC3S_04760 [Chloroflexota bacterium]